LVKRDLAWQPTLPLDQGFEFTIAWFKNLHEVSGHQP